MTKPGGRRNARDASRSAALVLFLANVTAVMMLRALAAGTVPERVRFENDRTIPSMFLRGGKLPRPGLDRQSQAVTHLRVAEIAVPEEAADEAVLGRPVALAFDGERLYVADALDCAVKVFGEDGRFRAAFGRKGQGPGELSFPSGVCCAGSVIAVADKLNFRIQLFESGGEPRGGFKLPFAPDRVFALDNVRILVTSNPTGRRAGERMLHAYGLDGHLLWEGLGARLSGDPVSAAFANMILVCPGEADDFYVLFRSGERTVLRYAGSGEVTGRVAVDGRHPSREVVMPVGPGGLRLSGFCWAAAFDRGRFYLSPPEALAGKDLGPGRTISVVDATGRLAAVIELPCPVHRFLVAGGRLFAIDDEESLRIFDLEVRP
jgi:hypothetical protein